jgi:hypothetical protein
MRERVLYHMKYRKGTGKMAADLVQECHLAHVNPKFQIQSIELQGDGMIERDGEQLVFHDLRIFLKEKP